MSRPDETTHRLAETPIGDWATRAACAGHDEPDLWYGPSTAEAIAICGECPVRAECLADALTLPRYMDHGIHGGTTADTRAAIRRGQITAEQALAASDEHRPAAPTQWKDCGTYNAFHRHRYHGERPCEDCRRAAREYNREYHLRRKARREAVDA